MQTFLKWAEENKLELPVFTDSAEARPTTDEAAKRTGFSANYPPGYIAARYPAGWFAPGKATAALDAQIMGKK